MIGKIAVFGFLLLPAAAWAQIITVDESADTEAEEKAPTVQVTPPTPQVAAPAPQAATPQVKDTPLTYPGKLTSGHELYMRGDFQGALTAYESAKLMSPEEPIAYYYLGFAQARLARYDDAIVTLRAACTKAGEKDPSLHAKALFAIAVVEEMRWNLEKAKEAWTGYLGFARTHDGAQTFPASAEARIAAIEKMKSLDEQYEVVRGRIDSSK